MKRLLSLALILSSLFGGSAFAQGLACEQIFLNSPAATAIAKPEKFIVDLSDKKSDDFLDQAFQNFLQQGKLEESRQIIQQISNQGLRSLTADELNTLKVTRKFAAILRSTLQIASDDHASPKDFENFVTDFGHLNDMIASQKDDGTRELAEKVLKDYKNNNFEKMQKKVETASRKSMRKYFEALHEEAEDLMAKKKLTLDQYHEVRKILKEFLIYYQLSGQVYDSQAFTSEYKYLFDLNEKLGKLNDTFTAEEIAGTADKEKTKMKYPEDLRQEVMYFLDRCQMLSK